MGEPSQNALGKHVLIHNHAVTGLRYKPDGFLDKSCIFPADEFETAPQAWK